MDEGINEGSKWTKESEEFLERCNTQIFNIKISFRKNSRLLFFFNHFWMLWTNPFNNFVVSIKLINKPAVKESLVNFYLRRQKARNMLGKNERFVFRKQ